MALESSHIISTSTSDLQKINLSRMITRFHQILITPDSVTEAHLRGSKSERAKLESNLAYAGRLLEKLEQETHASHGLGLKHENQLDFARKRKALLGFSQQLREINDLASYQEDESDEDVFLDESSQPDLILKDNSPTQDQQMKYGILTSPETSKENMTAKISPTESQLPRKSTIDTQSGLRARNKSERAELFQNSRSTGTDISATAESLMTHNRVEQEILTNSLLQMATKLKTSSQAFSSALEEEKGILENASQGLEKNELGLEAAQKRMGLLRTMTEGKGWWGRMLMYAWIFAMALGALLIVLLMPKLRL